LKIADFFLCLKHNVQVFISIPKCSAFLIT